MITSVDAERKSSTHFMIKALERTGLEGIYLNLIMTTYDTLTANIVPTGEKIYAFELQ